MQATSEAAALADLDEKSVRHIAKAGQQVLDEVANVITGQREIIEHLLICIFSGGHCLLTGVPGLAKTLIIKSLAELLDLQFNRIQFTPDLMPADIIGTEILEEDRATARREFRFVHGPVFANLILADEINRTPPKTQSALLQAMQEYKVTSCGRTFDLEKPFFVLATQNPIESQGTYTLPEAQLDRFMFNLRIGYLSNEDEAKVVKNTTSNDQYTLRPVLSGEQLRTCQTLVRNVPVSDSVVDYAVAIAAATRPAEGNPHEFVNKWVTWGAGPRGSQQIILAAKARALLRGHFHVSPDDVRAMAIPALRHRVITNYFAESEGADSDKIIRAIIKKTPEPKSGIR
jgi:MoxR-like ATPase